ncbi:MAG TPA: reverse transcriptase/maturase family protein [Terriglobia bacterium]|nr:reverse transcriptase/maturase family protein [Terriglobia bacterium]
MKRVGKLWAHLTSFLNLLTAAQGAAAGKRTRADVATFLLNLEWELFRLQRELKDGSYEPGPYRSFQVREPKPRLISAAPFRDRVVHHALTQVVEPVFEKRFSKDSFACRKGFGTHRALARARWGAARHRFVLKCDVRKYFPSIDHEILKGLLARAGKCRPTLDLAARIIDASNPQEEANWYYPGDDLFAPYERRRGLPLGNQTSQFFANLYLNPLDQMISRSLRPDVYVRYVDDFLLFSDSKERLHEMRGRIEEDLYRLRLAIHPRKSRIYRTAEGVTFLGWRVFPDHSRLVRENVARFRRRLRFLQEQYAQGVMNWDEIDSRVQAWIAHAAHGDTWRLREQLLEQFAFRRARGHSCGGCAGGLEPQSQGPALRLPQQVRS